MAALCTVNTASLKPVVMLHRMMRPSEPPETIVVPSAAQLTAHTSQLCI